MEATLVADNMIEQTLHDCEFREMHDGHWYPANIADSLVRVRFDPTEYQIERLNQGGTWENIVTANAWDFDSQTFTHWISAWPVRVDNSPT